MRNDQSANHPPTPFPDSLRGLETGTWAEHTVRDRLPDIGRRIIEENRWPPDVQSRLQQLVESMPDGRIDPIEDPGAPDVISWNRWIGPHQDETWLQVPWFFAETYFYRRVIAATRYFQQGDTYLKDPFTSQKETGLSWAMKRQGNASGPDKMELAERMLDSLWGNRSDLSIWPTEGGQDRAQADQPNEDHLLVDDRALVLEHLDDREGANQRIDLVLDNAGTELLADLMLIDDLLKEAPTRRLHIHAKAHPTYVSDAIPADIEGTVGHMATAEGAVGSAAQRLRGYLDGGQLTIGAHLYWTSPLPLWEAPQDLLGDLAKADLVMLKGDANYRRLLGDRHWPFDTAFGDIVGYFPTALVALRSVKADVAAGLSPRIVQRAEAVDPLWTTDGAWAVIQFHRPQ